ncbi:hydrogen peroxide-inducible genes activator [Thiofaba sp. EF100]|jgi:LysR family hydrogen peroxide-inducible transcriptional activator|uniref:hydrogen peroxide-inducible genes activator n=1 Tax=Thiofaba sp. EF100 TaxID=3121274 RepID=UPI003221DACE
MTLTELRYIVAVARERHFSRAAESCFVSQPTLSVGVRKLEEALGVQIFERGPKSEVRLTTAGERIVAQAQRVLEEVERLKQVARHSQDPLNGPLRLGLIYTIGPYLLPHLIPALHVRAPQMPLLIEEGFTSELAERLRFGELDVIVVSLPFSEPGVVTQAVYDEPFVVAMPPEHPWREMAILPPERLAEGELLMLGQGHCFRDQVLQMCPDCNRSAAIGGLQRTLEGSSLETIRHMVASGLGVTVLPCSSAQNDMEGGRLVYRAFREPVPMRRVVLAWRKSFPRPEAVEALRQTILEAKVPCLRMLPDQPIMPGRE